MRGNISTRRGSVICTHRDQSLARNKLTRRAVSQCQKVMRVDRSAVITFNEPRFIPSFSFHRYNFKPNGGQIVLFREIISTGNERNKLRFVSI